MYVGEAENEDFVLGRENAKLGNKTIFSIHTSTKAII